MTSEVTSAVTSERPTSVRALSVLLLLELAVAVVLVGLGVVGAIVAVLTTRNDPSGGMADLAVVVLLTVAGAAAVLAVLLLLAWLAVRGRRRSGRVLALVAQLVPPLTLGWLGVSTDPGRLLTLAGVVAVAVLGVGLTLAPATRRWLAG